MKRAMQIAGVLVNVFACALAIFFTAVSIFGNFKSATIGGDTFEYLVLFEIVVSRVSIFIISALLFLLALIDFSPDEN
ncbi:MAG: hypothetical protein R3251_00645 [Candidatus Spechtbacterales bacterium]|nr:hypothetical protein [Candidatus Spechtbacterales bacterium]